MKSKGVNDQMYRLAEIKTHLYARITYSVIAALFEKRSLASRRPSLTFIPCHGNEYAQAVVLGANVETTTVEFLAGQPYWFSHHFRLNPVARTQPFSIGDVEVSCCLRA